MRFKIASLLLFIFALNLKAQSADPLLTEDVEAQEKWVDSIMNNMAIEEKIGQLFMVAAYSNKDEKHEQFIVDMIEKYHIGSLIFFQDQPIKQAELTNKYQALSKTPLLIGIDGEWGLNMRLKDTYRYPWNMTLGAIQDNTLIEDFGKQVGQHCKRMGIHMNFAPVVDVNTNPENPIIGNRSFGENPENVANKSIAFTKGIQSKNIIATAKHFPGHGDTATDSHKTLPFLDFDLERLEAVEMYPYTQLFKKGLTGVMVAHLSIPSLEPNEDLPSSLSKKIVTDLLQDQMGFRGLIVSDALNMKGSANFASSAEVNLAAILAGNDLLDVPLDIPGTFKLFKEALKSGELTEARLDKSVKKLLKTKYWVGLNNYEPIKTDSLLTDINTVKNDLLFRDLVENSITLMKNTKQIFPIKQLENKKIAYVKLGDSEYENFVTTLQKYTQVDVVKADKLDVLMNKLESYNLVIIGFHKSNKNPWKSYKFTNNELIWLQEIARKHTVILDVFASPYSLLQVKSFKNIDGLLVSYQNSKTAQELSAQMIFGALTTKGKLPVSISKLYPEGYGMHSSKLMRLGYSIPEDVGLSSEKLQRIDSIFKVVMQDSMAPGGQVLVARYGKVVYHKSYGYHTYNQKQKVEINDLYDLASLTKILGGLPMIMKSYENGLFDLDSELGDIMPYLKNSNKDTIILRKALSHNGQLIPWIPYYVETLDTVTNRPKLDLYRPNESEDFGIKVAQNLYLKNTFTDTIYKRIADSDLREKPGYRYSGLIFYLFKKYFKDTYGQEMDVLDTEKFYAPLGATTLGFNPLSRFKKEQIVPSEKDDYYRNTTLQGDVHDMGAAMFNGVSGNAGLFGNSNDIAKMMQLYLQKGYYGGERLLNTQTLETFTKRHYLEEDVRRGLGFDKPQLDPEVDATCGCVSDASFGHSGFTGTYAWADPETQIVYVFLSNRVYPTMDNNKLGEENIRTKVQQLIVDAIVN
ncbi:MAG: glycoside hydrolase family 3 N-terminal domain-containing protein [Urechidicola sp.]|nr:glycoside hydrolase family 3 N-terminal domain-containing protein [Urechidicola sp.]